MRENYFKTGALLTENFVFMLYYAWVLRIVGR